MSVKNIVNLTNVPLKFLTKEGFRVVIPPGRSAKTNVFRKEREEKAIFDGREIKVNDVILRDVENLPPQEEGTIFIVSSFIYFCISHIRPDVFCVDEPVKEEGKTSMAKAISRPAAFSNGFDMKRISELIDSIDMSTQDEAVVSALFEIKTITNKYNQ